ncbi:MAG: HlyD family secretion protein [Alphaproteobacteria bacterium]|nr:MAG: HlyD family secretion protein [Alphaproteobacteria bacterium]
MSSNAAAEIKTKEESAAQNDNAASVRTLTRHNRLDFSTREGKRLFLLLLGPALLALIAGYFYATSGRYISTENAYIKTDKAMIAAEVSGPILSVAVRDNQAVRQGEVLFIIDDRTYQITLAAAEANLQNIRDELFSLRAGYHQKEAELSLARTTLAFAEKELGRQSKLLKSRTISDSAYDDAALAVETARQKIIITEQQLADIRAKLAGDPETPIEAHPKYLAAKASVDRAQYDLDRTVVRAPFDGIASDTPNVGEQVVGSSLFSSPVMSLVASDHARITANFKETELTHMKVGQPVTIHVDAYPGESWRGQVESIAQATGAEFSVIPPQNASGNWVKVVQRVPVRISIDPREGAPMLRAGMSAEVRVDTRAPKGGEPS